jgi:hypothetical protein
MANRTKQREFSRKITKAASIPRTSSTERIKALFRDDSATQNAIAEGLSKRVEASQDLAKLAHEHFSAKKFAPRLFTQRGREPRHFVAPNTNVPKLQERLIEQSVARLRDEPLGKALKLRLDGPIAELVKSSRKGSGAKAINFEDIRKRLDAVPLSPLGLTDEPAYTQCAAQRNLDDRLKAIEGKEQAEKKTKDEENDTKHKDDEPKRAKDFVEKHVHALLAKMPSPEDSPRLDPPERRDLDKLQSAVNSFELRSGPSDVTSYHDFNNLVIAFDHVWAEVFDDRLREIASEIYQHYFALGAQLGIKKEKLQELIPEGFTSNADIVALMTSAKTLGQQAMNAFPSTFDLTEVDTAIRDFLDKPEIKGLPEPFGGIVRTFVTTFADFLKIRLKAAIDADGASAAAALTNAMPSTKRLDRLLVQIESILKAPYAFTVFQENTANFGIMVTYRQAWRPENYQVGSLVNTIPLAPREVRRYTTRQVSKKSRAVKEINNNLNSQRTDIGETARADKEIVDRAENRTNFKMTADGSYGTDAFKVHGTAEGGGDAATLSATTKKNFREAVLKSAQEFRHDNRLEVEASSSDETESTTFHEIQNPNDELTVTYLFYELQRTYRISEKIHQVVPVVLVANKVPAPHEIDDAWLLQHDWILLRVMLDDSYRPALEYLRKGFVGDELNLQTLDNNVKAQRRVVDTIGAQVASQISIVEAAQRDLSTKMDVKGGLQFAEGILGTIKNVFDPFKLTGNSVTGTKEGMDTVADFAQQTLDRAEREKVRLLDQLTAATSALQTAVDKLTAAIREHYDKVAEVDRLRIHVKQNIIYYMQAIWNHEPPDQRYFRVFNVEVPMVELANPNQALPLVKGAGVVDDVLLSQETASLQMPMQDYRIEWRRLVEVADLDEVLGYKGNYAIYRLKKNNYLTLHMMQDYVELSDILKVRDPDDTANHTVDEIQELATCLYKTSPEVYKRHKKDIQKLILDRLMSGRPEDDRVIVPTKSLYIEALVGTHPLVEDFKLLHRALDVKKVQGEVRHGELENVRLAARALEGKLEDPDVEKTVIVSGGKNVAVTPQV